ncbi:MAG: prepilin peptidase [Pirellulales bacterium]|nr:prepilin peptidase [Pirellulales bacterium]
MPLADSYAFSDLPLWAWLTWLFVIGSCIGSFLNVVIYRLPVGKSLVRPGSHCPRCNKPIRARHNIPILGWLMLRGKCKDCETPISVRYPLVELAVGTIFFVLAGLIFGGGSGHMPESFHVEVGKRSFSEAWVWQTALYAYHVVLACFLVASGMIAVDEMRQKASLSGFTAFLGLATPLFAPWLRPTHFLSILDRVSVFAAIWDGLFGFSAGIAMGYIVAFARKGRRSFRADTMSVLAVIGAFLGWQAVLTVSAAASATELGRHWTSSGRTSQNPAPWITVAAFFAGVHLVAWRWISVYAQEQTETMQGVIMLVMLAVTVICSWGHQRLGSDEGDHQEENLDHPANRRRTATRDKFNKNRK